MDNRVKLSYQKWTEERVADRFEDAVRTLRRLPKVRVTTYFNSWPEVVHSTQEILRMEKQPLKLGPPSASDITKMEECLEWICWLDDENERLLIWLRAQRVYWKQICWRIGVGRTKAWQIHSMALLKIATRLNAQQLKDLHVRTKKH